MNQEMVIKTLTDKIEQQERTIADLRVELERVRQASIDTMLGQLRLREAVLLYIGQDTDCFAKTIAELFGKDAAWAVMTSLFVLDNAPVEPNVREAMRIAANHGMNRW